MKKCLAFLLVFVTSAVCSQEIILEDVADAIKTAKKRVIVRMAYQPLCITNAAEEVRKRDIPITFVFIGMEHNDEMVAARDRIAWGLHRKGFSCIINRNTPCEKACVLLDEKGITKEMRLLGSAAYFNMVIVDNQIFSWNEYRAPDREDTPIVRNVSPKEIEKWELLFTFVSRHTEHLLKFFPRDPNISREEQQKRFMSAEDPPFLGKYDDRIFHRNTCQSIGIGKEDPELVGRERTVRTARDLWIRQLTWLSFANKEQAELFGFKPCPDCKPLDENWVEKGNFVELKDGTRYPIASSVVTADGMLKVTLTDGSTKTFSLEDVVIHSEK